VNFVLVSWYNWNLFSLLAVDELWQLVGEVFTSDLAETQGQPVERACSAVVAAVPRQQQRNARYVLLSAASQCMIQHVVFHRQRLGQFATLHFRQMVRYELQLAQVHVVRCDSYLRSSTTVIARLIIVTRSLDNSSFIVIKADKKNRIRTPLMLTSFCVIASPTGVTHEWRQSFKRN